MWYDYNWINCFGACLHTCNPVDGDALHTPNSIGHNVLSPRLVSLGSADGAQAHVNPVDSVVVYRAEGTLFDALFKK